MQSSSRLFAFLAYIPLAGWLITWLLRRSDSFAMFHLRQAIMLVLTVVAVVLGWAVLAWLLTWIPFAYLLSTIGFALVILAGFAGVVMTVAGMLNALRGRAAALPLIGARARRLRL